MLCAPKVVAVRGAINSSSNFINHLKRKHGEEKVQDYFSYRKSKTVTRYPQLQITSTHHHAIVDQNQLNILIAKFIMHSMVALRIVDDPYFKAILEYCNAAAPSRRQLGRDVEDLYNTAKTSLKGRLNEAMYVCTTA